jgi:hypothetical protein
MTSPSGHRHWTRYQHIEQVQVGAARHEQGLVEYRLDQQRLMMPIVESPR